jgi:dipeptidyl aminopeptidase/acylaminoacyl peptidase
MKLMVSTATIIAFVSSSVAYAQMDTNSAAAAAPTTAAPAAPKKAIAASPLKDIPVESFAKIPFISDVEISPNGKMIAGLLGVKGEQKIAAIPIEKGKAGGFSISLPEKTQISWVRWVNDDNVLVGVFALTSVEADEWYINRTFSINVTTGKATNLLWNLNGQNGGDVLWIPSDGSNEVLIAAQNSIYSNDDEFWPSVYKVNVTNGKKSRIQPGRTDVFDWSTDAAGNVRAAIEYNDATQTSKLLYKPVGSSSFKVIDRAKLRSNEILKVPFMFIPGTNNGFVMRDNKNGQTSIYEMNIDTGADVRTVFEPKNGDVESAVVSYDGTKLLGARTSETGENLYWFDPDMAKLQSDFDATVKNGKARIISQNRDQTKMLVRINRPDNPGSIYYFDKNDGLLTRLSTINDAIGTKALSPVKMIKYKARDGLEIEAVLTLPKDKDSKNLPFIVLPHGGPWGQDTLSYDYWSQFLASRGYGVIQPNFRGSTGYGTEFTNKGKGQMGFAMQDDVTDGFKWAVAQGIADPKRTCIMGASYGGYAAMWGVVKDPDLYRCSISIAGVAALRREVNDFGGSTKKNLYTRQWKEMTPDFNAVSPILHIDKIKVPMLLIHGKKDITVKHVQSEKMFGAMKKADKNVEFVSVPLADHYFTREADRVTLLKSMEAFLAKHNPAD